MKKWPNIGERIKERLLALGFQRPNGQPDVMRFSAERRFLHVYIYRWLSGSLPDYHNMIRLAEDLKCSPCWLMFGDAGVLVPGAPVEKPPRSCCWPAVRSRHAPSAGRRERRAVA